MTSPTQPVNTTAGGFGFDPNSPVGTDFPGSGANTAVGISANVAARKVVVGGASGPSYNPTGGMHMTQAPVSDTVGNLLSQFPTMNPSEVWSLAGQLYQGGFFSSEFYGSSPRRMLPSDVYDAYKNALLQAAATGQPLTDTIQQGIAQMQASPSGALGQGGGGTYTTSSTSHLDSTTAVALANQVGQALYGRDLDQGELQNVLPVIRAYEQANPSVSTQAVSSGQGGQSSTDTTQGGATDAGRSQVVQDALIRSSGTEVAQQRAQTLQQAFIHLLSSGS